MKAKRVYEAIGALLKPKALGKKESKTYKLSNDIIQMMGRIRSDLIKRYGHIRHAIHELEHGTFGGQSYDYSDNAWAGFLVEPHGIYIEVDAEGNLIGEASFWKEKNKRVKRFIDIGEAELWASNMAERMCIEVENEPWNQ